MLDIMSCEQFDEKYDEALAKAIQVDAKEKASKQEEQEARVERKMAEVTSLYLQRPNDYERDHFKCLVILQESMKKELRKEIEKKGWEVTNHGYDKYEGGQAYMIKRKN